MVADSSEDATENDALQRVLDAGVEWVGREYSRRLRESLKAIGDEADEASWRAAGARPPDDWVTDVVSADDELPAEVYFEVILAAVDETNGDDALLWCIGDGPVDHHSTRLHTTVAAGSADL